MLRYENKKTGSIFNIPDEIKIEDMDSWNYCIKRLIKNDEKIIKKQATKLAIVLKNTLVRREQNVK